MTGFGHAEGANAATKITVEIKSVNHRFLDAAIKLPRLYNIFESDIRAALSSVLERGRVEVFVQRTVLARPQDALQFDRTLLDSLVKSSLAAFESYAVLPAETPQQERELKGKLIADLMRRSDVFQVGEELADPEAEKTLLLSTVEAALKKLAAMREREGQELRKTMEKHLAAFRAAVKDIQERGSTLQDKIRERYLERVKKLTPDLKLEEARLHTEVVILAERVDIHEELNRLSSHLEQFSEVLTREPSGKRFDFLLQEMHRELTTLSNKAGDAEVQQRVVDAKLELEKMKEQVQNLQ